MRFYLGVLLAAIVLFFWGFVYWTVLAAKVDLPQVVGPDHAVVKSLATQSLTHRVYVHDGGRPDEKGAGKDAAAETGPVIYLMFRPRGGVPAMREIMVQGFLHMLLSAALFATFTRCAVSWCSFNCRWAFVAALGVVASVWIDLSAPIWWHFPWDQQLFQAGYHIGAWCLAGVPLAWATAGTPVIPPVATDA